MSELRYLVKGFQPESGEQLFEHQYSSKSVAETVAERQWSMGQRTVVLDLNTPVGYGHKIVCEWEH